MAASISCTVLMLGTYPFRAGLASLASLLASLLTLLRVFAQSRRREAFRFRFRTGHCLMHGVRAKVNAAGPFHAAEIGIDGDGVEDTSVQQLQKHAAAPFRFNGENSARAIVEVNFQSALRKRF